MKKSFLIVLLTLLFVPATFAQDLESVTNLYNSGAVALNEGKKIEALKIFEDALSQAQTLGAEGMDIAMNCQGAIPTLYMSIGKEYGEKRDLTNAIKYLDLGIAKATEFQDEASIEEIKAIYPPLYMQEGSSKLNERKYPEAIACYKKVLEYNPNFAMAYLRMGMAASAIGDEATTVSSYEKAMELGQKNEASKRLSTYYLKKSVALLKAKKMTDAIAYAQKSAATMENAQAYNVCGKAALATKDNALATESFEKYLSLSPNAKDKSQAMYQLASAYMAMGKNAEACKYFKQIMNDPSFKDFATHQVKNVLKCQ